MSDFAKMLNEAEITISNSKVTANNLASLIKLVDTKVISSAIAKRYLQRCLKLEKILKQ